MMIRFDPVDIADGASPPPVRPLDVAVRFDEAIFWATLSPERQQAIGAVALALAASWAAQDETETGEGRMLLSPLGRAASHADMLAIDALVRLFDEAVPPEARLTPEGQPRLPILLGPVCRRCGCSELDACSEECGWAAPDLCTACIDLGERRDG